ncbi:Kiwa anti-phage protein KwaB-like domain-containing protein [Mesorhizobium australicum]|uniref:DUF4868 domain-containing protein n=1 Tax=Mesorhizobium australicum TaxID=536018 RepID=A0A1X7P3U3_9HYPH|nr:Kiwa anti-phage protein KwaB-like domain-containing protein [Mesorhizobium australicum]SMH45423.1 protein of unknown function [Mesorhizobium australicum]
MIENDIDIGNIASVNFGIALRSNGNLYFVPTDGGLKDALKEMIATTVALLNAAQGDWQAYDISEDYGQRRRIYCDRDNEYMAVFSTLFDAGALEDLTNLPDHVNDIDYYFAEITDVQSRRMVGVRKATQFKGTVKAKNRLVRMTNDTLSIIEDTVFKLDNEFDLLITDAHVYILNDSKMQQLADIISLVAATAKDKVQTIEDTITFLDLSRIKEKIEKHPRVARYAASIAQNPLIANFQRAKVESLAQQHGIVFKELETGKLQCRVQDEAKLMELLDARRYHLDLADNGGDPYRATGRQKV